MIYLVEKSSGSYDDYCTTILRAFLDSNDAEKAIEKYKEQDAVEQALVKEWQKKADAFTESCGKRNTPEWFGAWNGWYRDNPRPPCENSDVDYEIIEMELE